MWTIIEVWCKTLKSKLKAIKLEVYLKNTCLASILSITKKTKNSIIYEFQGNVYPPLSFSVGPKSDLSAQNLLRGQRRGHFYQLAKRSKDSWIPRFSILVPGVVLERWGIPGFLLFLNWETTLCYSDPEVLQRTNLELQKEPTLTLNSNALWLSPFNLYMTLN